MGALFADIETVDQSELRDLDFLHRMECRACPLNGRVLGKFPATGSDRPRIYMLGEAPGKEEENRGQQFIGPSGRILRRRIPKWAESELRWNNVVRTRPTSQTLKGETDRPPNPTEIEACRPSVAADIEQSQPEAIFGFGNVPLNWLTGWSGVTTWRGRRTPVRIGNHTCWLYPIAHPSYIARQRRGKSNFSEDERMFQLDLARAFADVRNGLPPPVVHTVEMARGGVEIIDGHGPDDLARLTRWLDSLEQEDLVGVDYETHGLKPYAADAQLLTIGVGTLDRGLAFAYDHPGAGWTAEQQGRVKEAWRQWLLTFQGVKTVHNLGFDLEWTVSQFGLELLRAGIWEDSQSQAAVLDERRTGIKPGPFSLEFLCQQYFGFNLKKLSKVNRRDLSQVPLPDVLSYNALDAKYHAQLWLAQAVRIEDEGLDEPYQLALRRVPTVVASQVKGVPVDQEEVGALQEKYDDLIESVEDDIQSHPDVMEFNKREGYEFNPSSNPDVVKLMRDKGFDEVTVTDKYTKKKKYSVDEEVLKTIAANHDYDLVGLLLKLRKYKKRKSTYVDPLAEGSPTLFPDGLLHATFNTTFAETGRLSCEGPNLQNFPKRDDDAREVRRPIKAPPGHIMLAIDYGQIEARVIAMLTKDPAFCRALWENFDVHMDWAERIAYEYPRRVGGKEFLKDKSAMKKFRTDIKNQWTFPLFFGAQLSSAANYLSIPEDVLRPLYDDFWDEFSEVKQWQERLLDFYHEYGYVECLTGRRRRGPLSLNQVINSPVQGTAAEIVMDAMCRLSETGDPELQPEINIHDDFTFMRVPEDRADVVAERVLDIMLNVPFPWVNVPITAEVSQGTSWEHMEEVGTFSSDKW